MIWSSEHLRTSPSQKFFEQLGYDSFTALVMEAECEDLDLRNIQVSLNIEDWSGPGDTEYMERRGISVYTLEWYFKGVRMKLEGTKLRQLVDMVIAAARAHQ